MFELVILLESMQFYFYKLKVIIGGTVLHSMNFTLVLTTLSPWKLLSEGPWDLKKKPQKMTGGSVSVFKVSKQHECLRSVNIDETCLRDSWLAVNLWRVVKFKVLTYTIISSDSKIRFLVNLPLAPCECSNLKWNATLWVSDSTDGDGGSHGSLLTCLCKPLASGDFQWCLSAFHPGHARGGRPALSCTHLRFC